MYFCAWLDLARLLREKSTSLPGPSADDWQAGPDFGAGFLTEYVTRSVALKTSSCIIDHQTLTLSDGRTRDHERSPVVCPCTVANWYKSTPCFLLTVTQVVGERMAQWKLPPRTFYPQSKTTGPSINTYDLTVNCAPYCWIAISDISG